MFETESISLRRPAGRQFETMHPLGMPGAVPGLPGIPGLPGPGMRSRFIGPFSAKPASLAGACMAAVLDELDYGIVLIEDGDCKVATVNHAARMALDDDHPLRLAHGRLEARLARDIAPLRKAVDAAFGQGLRRLLTLGDAQTRTSISVVPLSSAEDGRSAVLVIFGKSAVCEALSISGFCQSHGLTWAEGRVLAELTAGTPPKDIARHLDVSITTVRTHISSMRTKTGAPNINALLARVAILPPLRSVLRPGVHQGARTSLS
jgi:DNA-binding CsgD family transcriptional regulator